MPPKEDIIKYIFGIVILLIFINLVILDVRILNQKDISQTPPAANLVAFQEEEQNKCSSDCLDKIKEATSSIAITNPTPQIIKQTVSASNNQDIKDIFIPIGSGETQSDDWADVPGVSAYIDSSNYKNIKAITFEASIYNPGTPQKIYVRLFNSSDNNPVWNTEMSYDGSTAQLLISQPFVLPPGNKLYKVQMKAALRALAKLTQARLHVVLN